MTYARRYSYAAIVGVAAAGEDDDGNAASGKRQEPDKQPEAKGVFESEEMLNVFVKNCVQAIRAAGSAAEVKDQKILNLARWNAMKDSASQQDRAGHEQIVAVYNEAFGRFKAANPVTVDAAKQTAALPATVADDTIAL